MAQVTVTLARRPGPSEEECKRFLWCLARRLEIGPRDDIPEPTPEDLEEVEPLQVIDFTVEAEDLPSARTVVFEAAAGCVRDPFGLYEFRPD